VKKTAEGAGFIFYAVNGKKGGVMMNARNREEEFLRR
jgi:hypothetical protein